MISNDVVLIIHCGRIGKEHNYVGVGVGVGVGVSRVC